MQQKVEALCITKPLVVVHHWRFYYEHRLCFERVPRCTSISLWILFHPSSFSFLSKPQHCHVHLLERAGSQLLWGPPSTDAFDEPMRCHGRSKKATLSIEAAWGGGGATAGRRMHHRRPPPVEYIQIGGGSGCEAASGARSIGGNISLLTACAEMIIADSQVTTSNTNPISDVALETEWGTT